MIPIVGLILGIGDPSQLRSDATSGFSGSRSFYYGFIQGLIPFLSYYFFAVYLKYKTTLTKYTWYISLFFALLASIQSLSKAPVIFYIFSLIILYYVSEQKKFNFKKLLIMGTIFFSAIILFYTILQGGIRENIFHEVIMPMLNRAFAGQIRPLYYYMEMFPNHHDFLLGQSIGLPSFIHSLIYDDRYIISVEIMNYIHPGHYIDRVGRANTIYWGEAYANFSILGIIVISVLAGFIMKILDILLTNNLNTLNMAIYVYLIMYFTKLVFSGFSIVLLPLSSSFLYIALVYIILKYYPKVKLK